MSFPVLLKEFLLSFSPPSLPSSLNFLPDSIESKVKGYRISNEASFGDKINYVAYRIWNAIKAVFNKSDWQIASEELETKISNDIKKLPLVGSLILEAIDSKNMKSLVELGLLLSIDTKLEKFYSNKDDPIKKLPADDIARIMAILTSLAKEVSSDLGFSVEAFDVIVNENATEDQKFMAIQQFMRSLITKYGLKLETVVSLLHPQSSAEEKQKAINEILGLVPKFFDVIFNPELITKITNSEEKAAKIIFSHLVKNDLIESATLTALINVNSIGVGILNKNIDKIKASSSMIMPLVGLMGSKGLSQFF